jgi:putative FmdB family regulatory protein
MPLYEYRCDACGHQFEVIQKFSDAPIDVCPACGKGPVAKLLSSPAIQFKGSGWYITDYARKDGAKSTSDSSQAKPSTGSPSSSSASDSAPSSSSSAPSSTPASSSKND